MEEIKEKENGENLFWRRLLLVSMCVLLISESDMSLELSLIHYAYVNISVRLGPIQIKC